MKSDAPAGLTSRRSPVNPLSAFDDDMRDPKRIDRVLAAVRDAWMNDPDWRLGQLLVNALRAEGESPDLFSVEDERLEKMLARLSEGKTMIRHAFNVADTFEIQSRGLVVATDKPYVELTWLLLKIGDAIEFRQGDTRIRSRVAGIEFVDPWTPQTPIAFLLRRETTRDQVPIGSEIWVTASSLKSPLDKP